jgi:hypothetical protein
VQVIFKDSPSPGRCAQLTVMQIPLITGIDEYEADLWRGSQTSPWVFTASGGPDGTGSGPYGVEVYSTKSVTYGITYDVPKGFGAWLVGYGSGPGPCETPSSSNTVQLRLHVCYSCCCAASRMGEASR